MKLNLGSGGWVKEGWDNLEYENFPGVIQTDLTKPLKYWEGSVDLIFTEHFIEHITGPEAQALLHECFRVLKPGGGIRISTPDLGLIAHYYLRRDLKDFKLAGLDYESPAQMINVAMHEWGHKYLFDFEELERMLKIAGFSQIGYAPFDISRFPGMPTNSRNMFSDLTVEAVKLS